MAIRPSEDTTNSNQKADTMSNRSKPQGGTGRPMPYQSEAQMKADMERAEYNKDPAFRENVRQRIAASDLWNTWSRN